MPVRPLSVLFALFAFCSLVPPSSAQDREPAPRTLALIGTGEVRTRPDIAIVTIGVTKRADTAGEALAQNNSTMAEILDHLKQSGIEPKDLQTSNFTVSPAYFYENQGQQPPKIIGYDVSNQLVVTLRDLNRLGTLLDQVVSKGSNQIYGIGFSLAEPKPLEDEARRLAIADAMRKARLYAEGAGVSLGNIVNISEFVQPPPVPVYMKAERGDAAGSVPIAAGEQLIAVQVNISWEIR
jgi:uncharacterized protein YggE